MSEHLSWKVNSRILVALLNKYRLLTPGMVRLLPFLKIENELFYLKDYLSPGNVAIDVGANVGLYTVLFSGMVGANGLVLSFEPYDETFQTLKKVVNFGKKLHNVSMYNIALGNANRQISLRLPKVGNQIQDALVGPDDSQNGPVSMMTLDKLAVQLKLARVDFIKVDVEGFELRVLEGAVNVLSIYHPVILVEVNDDFEARYDTSFRLLDEFLRQLGYRGFYFEGKQRKKLVVDSRWKGNALYEVG